jgi:hypothetical protein
MLLDHSHSGRIEESHLISTWKEDPLDKENGENPSGSKA